MSSLEYYLNELKMQALTTTRATHNIYYSVKRGKWVVNLSNKRKSFYADKLLDAVQSAYSFINENRKLKNDNGEYVL